MRLAFAVVPPMSNEITFRSPIAWAIALAPITPPTGPDSTRWIGTRCACANVVVPPFDCIEYVGQASPICESSRSSVDKYRDVVGFTYAFITAVFVRSYSLHCCVISCESVTDASGSIDARISRVRASCDGSAYE
jgi:hypothetical protein